MKKRLPLALSLLSWILFVLFLFFWFKDNIPHLRSMSGGPLLPFVFLAAVMCLRIILAWRAKTFRLRLRPNRTTWMLAAIILLAVIVRLPVLVYGSGILNSDDAIPALMGKHIAEGRVPPISYYGQLYMGSTTSHVFGLAFKIFGYSISVLLSTTLLFYLGFLAVQFVFLKEIVSREFAAVVGLFYALPIGSFMRISLGETAAIPLILLIGAVLFYLSFRIAWKGEDRWLSLFGFLSGIAFWTHQATVAAILAAWLAVLIRSKPSLKRYATLFLPALVGLFPLLMQEVNARFQMADFLTAGDKQLPDWAKLAQTARFARNLLSSSDHPLTYVFVLMLLVGCGVLAYQGLRKKEFRPGGLYPLYFALFFGVYLFSGFSNRAAIRYLYPSYLCLPVLLFGGVWFLLRRRKIAVSLAILGSLLAFNGDGSLSVYRMIRSRSLTIGNVVAAMEATGVKYWQADYWTAYLLTAIAGEKVIVDAYTVNRYSPYSLDYYNRGRRGAFVFMKDTPEASRGAAMVELLKFLAVPFRLRDVDGTRLIYGLEGLAFRPRFIGVLIKDVPPRLPEFRLEEAKTAKGYLRLSFGISPGGELPPGTQIRAEIPSFSSTAKNLSSRPEDNRLKLAVPRRDSFKAVYGIEYCGLKIPASARALSLSLPTPGDARRRDRIVYLAGLGPKTNFFGREMRVLEKEVRIELNRLKKAKTRLRLSLFSPFEFEHTFWYGNYVQCVHILLNGKPFAEKPLRDKDNLLEIEIEAGRVRRGRNLLTLKFDYHLPLIFAPLKMTAALLETIAVEQDPS
jgi:hypothetical protein